MSIKIAELCLRNTFQARATSYGKITTATTYSQKNRKRQYASQPSKIWPLKSHERSDKRFIDAPSRRNCIVTGATSGIGYEVVKSLINDGASSVRLVTRDVGRAESAIEALKRDTGLAEIPVGIIEGDLSSVDGIVAGWAKFNASIKDEPALAIDTLINCAGISQNQLLQKTGSDEISKILNINLQGPIELSKAFLNAYQSLALQRRGIAPNSTATTLPSFCVVNISSLLADKTHGSGTSVYTASKAGLTAFTRALAVEGSYVWSRHKTTMPPFRANVVVPGYIDTRMTSNFTDAHKKKLIEDIPLARFGTPEEVAQAVLFLLRNEYANNTVLNLDGGLSAM